jgi:predicted signal transduction protein with EAL and GGDEF domain
LGIEHSASDVDRVVTISLGVATLTPTVDLGFQTLIEAADKQLYEAKQARRARVCSSFSDEHFLILVLKIALFAVVFEECLGRSEYPLNHEESIVRRYRYFPIVN